MNDITQLSDDELLRLIGGGQSAAPSPQPSPKSKGLSARELMPSLIQQESGGRVGVEGPQTKYGRAYGLTQMLPSTAKGVAKKLGVEWRPDLLRGKTEEAAQYQRTLGEAYLQEALDATGNVRDALHYYHGGPDRKLWGKRTRRYAQEVLDRAGVNDGQGGGDLADMSDADLLAAINGGNRAVAEDRATPAAQAGPVSMADIHKTFTPGYSEARKRIEQRRATVDQATKRSGLPEVPGGELIDQMFANMGVNAPMEGASEWLNQTGSNVLARLRGDAPTGSAKAAYQAGKDIETERAAKYAQENPGKNVLASVLGVAVSGRPGVNAAGVQQLGRVGNALQTGAQAAAANAPLAAIRSEGDLKDFAKEEAMVFGLGSVGEAGANFLLRAAARAKAAPSAARQLANEGVLLTPGQIAEDVIPVVGGGIRRTEDAISSLGLGVNSARRRGFATLNQAGANRALREIGEELPKDVPAGFEAVKYVGDRLGAVYDDAAAKAGTFARDAGFDAAVKNALDDADQLIDFNVAEGLKRAVTTSTDRAFANGAITGQRWKELDSHLAAMARETDNSQASEIIGDVRTALSELLERNSTPEVAKQVRAANKGWATLMRLERAAKGSVDGVATPAKLAQSAERMGGRKAGTGEALLQDLGNAGKKVLPSTIPDTGNVARALPVLAAGGAGGVATGTLPMAAAAAAGVGILYSKPVQVLINALYRAKTPGAVRSALGRLKSLAARNPALVPVYQQALEEFGPALQAEGRQSRPERRRVATRR